MTPSPKAFCNRDIFESGIGQIAIVRFKSRGRVEIGVFLIDVFCLGVKNAFFTQCDEAAFDKFMEDLYSGCGTMDEHSAAWGRKLVEGAMGYARRHGFAPHPDYKQAARVMGGINPKDCEESFVFGSNGKPLFVGGPNDTQTRCDKIISVLTKKYGTDGFDFVIPTSDFESIAMSEDWDDEEE